MTVTRETREKINNEMADKVRDAIVRSRATRNASDADARFLKALTKERLWSDSSKSAKLPERSFVK